LQGLSQQPQDAGLAYASVASDLDIAAGVKRLVHSSYALVPSEYDLSNLIVDIRKHLACVLGENCTRTGIPPLSGKSKSERLQGLKKGTAVSIASVLRHAYRELNETCPERVYTRSIVDMQCAECSLSRQVF